MYWANTDEEEIQGGECFENGEITEERRNLQNNEAVLTIAPNPSGDYTKLSLDMKEDGNVQIFITDINGRLIKTVANGRETQGIKSYYLSTANMPAGMYFVTYRVNGRSSTTKLAVTH